MTLSHSDTEKARFKSGVANVDSHTGLQAAMKRAEEKRREP